MSGGGAQIQAIHCVIVLRPGEARSAADMARSGASSELG